MNIQDKYNSVRSSLKNGDIILFAGSGMVAKLIKFFDNAYYNHVGIVFEANGRLFIVDSNAPGVHADFLSDRIGKYKDFGIVRLNKSPEEIEAALDTVMDKAQLGIKYNFGRLFQIAIYKKLGWDIKKLDGSGKDICSQFAQQYTNAFPIKCFQADTLITPQGFIRECDPAEATCMFNDLGK